MFRSKYRITLDDGTVHEVTSGPREQILLERRYNIPSSHSARLETARLEYRLFTAWAAMKHSGATELEFDAWLEHLADVELFVAEVPERLEAFIVLHQAGWEPPRIAAAFDVTLAVLAQWCGLLLERDDQGQPVDDDEHIAKLVATVLEGGDVAGEAQATSPSPAG